MGPIRQIVLVLSLLAGVAVSIPARTALAQVSSCAWPNCTTGGVDTSTWPLPLPVPPGNVTTNPHGPLVVDLFRLMGTLVVNGRDDDGDLYMPSGTGALKCALPTTPGITDVTDTACDPGYPSSAVTTFTLPGTEASLTGTITTPDAADALWCRDSSTGVTCTTGGTCAATVSAAHPRLVVVKDSSANAYYLTNVYGVTGCGSTSVSSITIAPVLPFTIEAGVDTFQNYLYDNVHPSPYWYDWLADQMALLDYAAMSVPASNLATNGTLDSAPSGWTETDTAGVIAASALSDNDYSAAQAIYGGGAKITLRIDASGNFRTDAWSVDPTISSHVQCSFVYGSSNASNLSRVQIRMLNGATNAALGVQEAWAYGFGRAAVDMDVAPGVTQDDRLFYGGKLITVDGQITGISSIKLEVAWSGGAPTSGAWVDDILCQYGGARPDNGLVVAGLMSPIPAIAGLRMSSVGDSIVAPGSLWGGLAAAVTTRWPIVRSGLSFRYAPDTATAAAAGSAAPGFFGYSGTYTSGLHLLGDYLLSDLGNIDVVTYGTKSTVVRDTVKQIVNVARARGQLPILVLPMPHSIDTTATGLCTGEGTTTCGAAFRATSKAIRDAMPF